MLLSIYIYITENDLMTILQNKDKDLVLAAELGKALLEKNEELSKENERIAEEFSHKLEVKIISSLVLSLFSCQLLVT